MTLRTKLFLSFLSLSMLIIIVGLIYFTQLKSLIEPLSPRSIPLGLEKIENQADANDLINHLFYRQLVAQDNLQNYVFTGNSDSLQVYYMASEMLYQLIKKNQSKKLSLWKEITPQYEILNKYNNQILEYMKNNQNIAAKSLMNSLDYKKSSDKLKKILSYYFNLTSASQHENAIVSVRIAAKNSTNILKESLNSTLVIFFDAVVISLILAIFGTRTIFQPVKILRNDIEKMTTKDLNIPLNNNLLTLKGEIGDLARSFAVLISKLRATTVLRDELINEIGLRKKSEELLRLTALRLKESNYELDQFAYAASHDLRAPLRAIESLSQWIKEDCYETLPDESRKHFDLLIGRVRRLDNLISGMLEYARAGTPTENLEKVNVRTLILECIENLSPPPHFQISVADKLPILITNKVALTRIFLNLISNAIKYNDKSKGIINITCDSLDEYYQFSIKDNGPGIEPIYHQKIFELFQTLQSRDAIEGAGIGLATVKKILDKIGGKIWLVSKKGYGTTFYFTWPKN